MELRFTNSQGPGRPTFRITSNAFDETITLTPATGASSSPVPLAITQADLTTNQIQPIVYTTRENGKPKTITGNAAIKAVNVLDTTSNVLGEFLLLLMIPDVVANPTDFNEVHVFSGASGQSLTVAGTPLMDNRIAQTTNLSTYTSSEGGVLTGMTIGIIDVTKVKGVSPDADFLWLAKWGSQQLRLPGKAMHPPKLNLMNKAQGSEKLVVTSNATPEAFELLPSHNMELKITQADLQTNQINQVSFQTWGDTKKVIKGTAAIKVLNVSDPKQQTFSEILVLLMIPDPKNAPTVFNDVFVYAMTDPDGETAASTISFLEINGHRLVNNNLGNVKVDVAKQYENGSISVVYMDIVDTSPDARPPNPDSDFLWLAKWGSQQLRLPGDNSTSFPVWAIVLLSIAAVCVVIGATFLIVHSLRANSVEETIDSELRGGAIYAL